MPAADADQTTIRTSALTLGCVVVSRARRAIRVERNVAESQLFAPRERGRIATVPIFNADFEKRRESVFGTWTRLPVFNSRCEQSGGKCPPRRSKTDKGSDASMRSRSLFPAIGLVAILVAPDCLGSGTRFGGLGQTSRRVAGQGNVWRVRGFDPRTGRPRQRPDLSSPAVAGPGGAPAHARGNHRLFARSFRRQARSGRGAAAGQEGVWRELGPLLARRDHVSPQRGPGACWWPRRSCNS